MKQFKPNTREYRILKFYWRFYLKSYGSLEATKIWWFSHLKDRQTQEQLVQEGLGLSERFMHTYFSAHQLVKAFQDRDYTGYLKALDRVENVNPQLMTTVKKLYSSKI